MKSLRRVQPSATPWTAAHQAPPSMGFSRQEYWSGVPLPSPGLQSRGSQRVRHSDSITTINTQRRQGADVIINICDVYFGEQSSWLWFQHLVVQKPHPHHFPTLNMKLSLVFYPQEYSTSLLLQSCLSFPPNAKNFQNTLPCQRPGWLYYTFILQGNQ